ncbi:hypothetical protein P0W64_09625 [Tsukamurella sp. 8F]|uniref:hypothetical protein n=1 Tax=unclassified Tsukamurella TaxID=2633480 RepID=UPI0023B93DCC|nr:MULTISPECIES: hypothetical protein [unclassified Tsukamurella]MDF0529838.1 hypothetical protein [Tsukamurella sp. 8J]MDF0587030.1 hypothetical protein [Tsukamurella sp. 8F]
MSETAKSNSYVDNGWPREIADAGEHAVSEFAAPLVGALSPFGEVAFPQENVPYIHPVTKVNR